MNFGAHLKALRESRQSTKSDLAKKVRVSDSYISQLESGARKPPVPERCQQIANALRLSENERKRLLQIAESERTAKERKAFSAFLGKEKSTVEVPFLQAAPSNIETFASETHKSFRFPTHLIQNRKIYLLAAGDDSMIGANVTVGDTLIVDADAALKSEDIAVLLHQGETLIRKFFKYGKTVVLESANPKYPKIELESKDEAQLRGVVVGILKKGFLA